MNRLFAIVELTFRESLAKKTFMAFFGISTLICLLFIFALNLDIVNSLDASISLFGAQLDGRVDIYEVIYRIQGALAAALFSAGIFISLFATSSLVPAFLDKGSIDLMISKPLSRFQILMGRYLGAIAIVAFNIFYLVIFSWLVLSLKTGIWNWGFLLSGVMIVITFAILFALMTFLGVIVRSGPFSLIITYLVLFFSPFLIGRDYIYALLSSKYYGYLLDGLYHFLPKTAELGDITRMLVEGLSIHSWLPLWTSLGFGIIMLMAANFIFSRKDF